MLLSVLLSWLPYFPSISLSSFDHPSTILLPSFDLTIFPGRLCTAHACICDKLYNHSRNICLSSLTGCPTFVQRLRLKAPWMNPRKGMDQWRSAVAIVLNSLQTQRYQFAQQHIL